MEGNPPRCLHVPAPRWPPPKPGAIRAKRACAPVFPPKPIHRSHALRRQSVPVFRTGQNAKCALPPKSQPAQPRQTLLARLHLDSLPPFPLSPLVANNPPQTYRQNYTGKMRSCADPMVGKLEICKNVAFCPHMSLKKCDEPALKFSVCHTDSAAVVCTGHFPQAYLGIVGCNAAGMTYGNVAVLPAMDQQARNYPKRSEASPNAVAGSFMAQTSTAPGASNTTC